MLFISVLSTDWRGCYLALDEAMFNPTTGIIASLFLISSPLFWFYGEIALPIPSICSPSPSRPIFSTVLWKAIPLVMAYSRISSVVGGSASRIYCSRAHDYFCLLPHRHLAHRRAVILGALVSLAWFIPLNGAQWRHRAYLDGSAAFTASFLPHITFRWAGEFGLKRNIINKLIPYTLYAWS